MTIVVTEKNADRPHEIEIAITVAETHGIADAIRAVPLPKGARCAITEVAVLGPPTSAEIRAVARCDAEG